MTSCVITNKQILTFVISWKKTTLSTSVFFHFSKYRLSFMQLYEVHWKRNHCSNDVGLGGGGRHPDRKSLRTSELVVEMFDSIVLN